MNDLQNSSLSVQQILAFDESSPSNEEAKIEMNDNNTENLPEELNQITEITDIVTMANVETSTKKEASLNCDAANTENLNKHAGNKNKFVNKSSNTK